MRIKTRYKIAVYIFAAAALAAIAFLYPRRGGESGRWPVTTLSGSALGTVFQVSVKGDCPEDLRLRLDSLFRSADASLSVYNPESTLSRINSGLTDTADLEIIRCIETARQVSEMSSGLYDITVGPLTKALGFSSETRDTEADLDSLLALVGYRKLHTDGMRVLTDTKGMQIDLNSIAKGAVVDMTARMLDSMGITDYLVDIGGEIFSRGTNASGKDWTIGVETPFEGNFSMTGDYIYTTVSVSGQGLATSGNYRNFYRDADGEKVTHIVNPVTGASTEGRLLSATVVAPSCALADALGTMFICLDLDRARETAQREDIAALFIYAQDGKMLSSVSPRMRQYIGKNRH